MSKINTSQEVINRVDELWDLLNSSIPAEEQPPIPIKVEEIKKVLDDLDNSVIIDELKNELIYIVNDINKKPIKFQAMQFSWFYDGGDIPDNATGEAYEKCLINYDFLKSDGSLERENPELSGTTFYLGYLSINKVMSIWYNYDMELFMGLDDDVYIKDSRNDKEYELQNIYKELFMLKLVSFLAKAYEEIKEEKPPYFLIKTHERWPILVIDNS